MKLSATFIWVPRIIFSVGATSPSDWPPLLGGVKGHIIGGSKIFEKILSDPSKLFKLEGETRILRKKFFLTPHHRVRGGQNFRGQILNAFNLGK